MTEIPYRGAIKRESRAWCCLEFIKLCHVHMETVEGHIVSDSSACNNSLHDDVIKWKRFPRYWPLCGEFPGHRWIPSQRPVTQSFDVSFICAWIDGWVNNRNAGDLRRHCAHHDITVMNVTLERIGFSVITLWLPYNYLSIIGTRLFVQQLEAANKRENI